MQLQQTGVPQAARPRIPDFQAARVSGTASVMHFRSVNISSIFARSNVSNTAGHGLTHIFGWNKPPVYKHYCWHILTGEIHQISLFIQVDKKCLNYLKNNPSPGTTGRQHIIHLLFAKCVLSLIALLHHVVGKHTAS